MAVVDFPSSADSKAVICDQKQKELFSDHKPIHSPWLSSCHSTSHDTTHQGAKVLCLCPLALVYLDHLREVKHTSEKNAAISLFTKQLDTHCTSETAANTAQI